MHTLRGGLGGAQEHDLFSTCYREWSRKAPYTDLWVGGLGIHLSGSSLLGARGAGRPHLPLAVSAMVCPEACKERSPGQTLC